MRYLTVGDVLRINEAEAGSPDLLRDFGLLESATLRPQTSAFGQDAYPTLHSKAAALMHSLIRNHPFVDGNKRTAVIAVIVFYGLNGYWIEVEQGELVGLAKDVAEGIKGVDDIELTLKNWATAVAYPEENLEDEFEDE